MQHSTIALTNVNGRLNDADDEKHGARDANAHPQLLLTLMRASSRPSLNSLIRKTSATRERHDFDVTIGAAVEFRLTTTGMTRRQILHALGANRGVGSGRATAVCVTGGGRQDGTVVRNKQE